MDILSVIVWGAAILFSLFVIGFVVCGVNCFRIYRQIYKIGKSVSAEEDRFNRRWKR